MFFGKKDFVSIKDLTSQEIIGVLDTAETMKCIFGKNTKKAPYLQGKTVITLFYEASSRTRLSYELAAQYLSANIVDINAAESDHLINKESIVDMGKLVDQMGGDFIILRHSMSGSARLLSENCSVGVMNAGDGLNENPSQSLLELLTIKNKKGGFKGLKVVIVGDVAHSRVARSNIWALIKLGAEVNIVGPPTLIPTHMEEFGVKVFYDLNTAIRGADVIMTLRTKVERQQDNVLPSYNEYKNLFKVDMDKVNLASKDAIVMHPGPINRGIELSTDVIASPQCLVDDQIANGVAVRMALLYLMSLKGGEK